MSDNLQKLGALAFALVAISVSGTAIHNALSPEDRILIPTLGDERYLSGQVSTGGVPINDFTAEQTALGVTLPKDAHNFFTCSTGGAVGVGAHDLGSIRAWVYEFTGTEPPFTGDFWISPGELEEAPQYASINTLQTYKEGRRYYSMSEEDLYFMCGEGVSLPEYCGDSVCQNNEDVRSCADDCNMCGDGVVFGSEACDDSNTANNDGCDDGCGIEPFYQCGGSPSSCSLLVPTLPGQGGSSSGGSSNPNNNVCQDTDGGHTPGTRGTATINGQSQTDLCSGNTLSEFNCQFGFMEALQVDCSATGQVCQNGACITAGTTSSSNSPGSSAPSSNANNNVCNDTDGGHKPLEFGTATINGRSSSDVCQNNNVLTEYNCSFGFMEALTVDCAAQDTICKNGACVFVTLHDAYIEGDELAVTYSKNVPECAELFKHNGPRMFPQIDFMCPSGTDITKRAPLNQLSGLISVGRRMKICADGVCSDPIAIRSVAPNVTHTECNTIYNRCEEVQGAGNDECNADSDCGGSISLASASIDAGEITLNYSKGFATCSRIRKRGVSFSPVNFPCPQGDNLEATRSLSAYSDPLNVGDEIKLCHGNNGNLCSDFVTITAPVSNANTGDLFVTQDSTPLRNRQLLGGELGEPVFRLQFHAEGEDIDVTDIRLINSVVIDSIDRLELYTEGTSTPFAVATIGGCAGNGGGNVFCANMENRQLVVPDGQDIDVLVRPRIKTDVQGGTSNETVAIALIHPSNNIIAIEARGDDSSNDLLQNNEDSTAAGEIFIGTNSAGPNGNYPSGNANRTVHAKFTAITNRNPDANGTSVPTGVSPIGQFKFAAASHSNSRDGNNDAILDGIIFNVNATNVAITASSFTLYNKADQTKTLDCQPHYLGGQPFTAANISGSFYVRCAGIDSSIIDSEIDEGTDTTFVLQADIVNPNVAASVGGVSVLQVSLDNFDQPGPNMNIDFGFDDSHVRWFDKDASTNETFHWIEYPETVVRSTSYNS